MLFFASECLSFIVKKWQQYDKRDSKILESQWDLWFRVTNWKVIYRHTTIENEAKSHTKQTYAYIYINYVDCSRIKSGFRNKRIEMLGGIYGNYQIILIPYLMKDESSLTRFFNVLRYNFKLHFEWMSSFHV